MESVLDDFPAAYLINLPERTDRLKRASKELVGIGWKVGTAGVQLFAARKFTDRAGFPNAGARGCFHSHMDCLQNAMSRGQPNVMLLEDDIAFASCLPKLTTPILSQLRAISWDFCYLGHEQTGDLPRANSKTSDVKLRSYSGDILQSHWVMVNGRILCRLVAHLERVAAGTEGDQEYGPMPIDGAYNIFRRKNPDVRTVIAVPKLGWQFSSRSDIAPRHFDNWRWARPLTTSIRHLKYIASRWGK